MIIRILLCSLPKRPHYRHLWYMLINSITKMHRKTTIGANVVKGRSHWYPNFQLNRPKIKVTRRLKFPQNDEYLA